jgi:hypothetical protein
MYADRIAGGEARRSSSYGISHGRLLWLCRQRRTATAARAVQARPASRCCNGHAARSVGGVAELEIMLEDAMLAPEAAG